MSALQYILSELLVSWHLLEGEKTGGTDVEEEIGQRLFTEHLVEVFMFSMSCQHLISHFCVGHTDLMVLVFPK